MQYTLRNVYKSVPQDIREMVVSFWLSLGVLGEEEAQRRVDEVVFVIMSDDGALVGVNTVYIDDFTVPNNLYYFYRTLIHPNYRYSYVLLQDTISMTFDFLQSYDVDGEKPKGVAIIIENRKFSREGAKDRLHKLGFTYVGKNPYRQDIWYRNFEQKAV